MHKMNEQGSPKEVLISGDAVEWFDTNEGRVEAPLQNAVEFDGNGRAYWWDVLENKRKVTVPPDLEPKTIKNAPWGFTGQNYASIKGFFTDPEGHTDRFGDRIRENRKEARDAIRANR